MDCQVSLKITFNSALILMALSTIALMGCSTPASVVPKLHQYLSPKCYDLMTKPGFNGYQYISQHPAGRGVFAIASEDGRQACADSTTREGVRDWNSLEVIALGRCEDLRKAVGIRATCKVFARDFDILLDEKKTYGLE